MSNVIVFGSINMDLVVRTPRLPLPGETLLGHDFFTTPGGKGANQAVATARLGVPTQIVGRVGQDSYGSELVNSLKASGVQTDYIYMDEAASSGVAVIVVDERSENQIIVVPGANGHVDEADVAQLVSLLPVSALLLQMEIPMQSVLAAAQAARTTDVTVILDPAPAEQGVPEQLYPLVDIITPNEIEAGQLVGFPIDGPETATRAAAILRQRGVSSVIVKLGAQGALCVTEAETFLVPAFPVLAIDTVAAGDAFNGGLAAALFEGLPLRQAVVWGAAAGAIASTKPGAQSAMCDRQTLMSFLNDMDM
ncbi:MAG: ribokinase [Chroococcidiopsidaceae cyanobacterium CP_BM_RX_35]|nr:ribokinase [Chroococcidiopsidaceae cyanobacterium CP_BM_RX_35]